MVISPDFEGPISKQGFSMTQTERDFLRGLLLFHGALLFRGFSFLDIPQFGVFAGEFAGHELLDYVAGASPRTRLGHGVYTSTEYPSGISLSLHNELSYTSSWPEMLFFYCVTPPKRGGETPLGDSRRILNTLDQKIVGRFKNASLKYVRHLEDEIDSPYSWRAAFETNDRSRVEKHCVDSGIAWIWDDRGDLQLSEVRPATAVHPKTGDEVWFNQADGFHPSVAGLDAETVEEKLRLNVFFGDGSRIAASDLDQIRETVRRERILIRWREGDLLVVDNMLACHGRMPFDGPRKILLAMA